MNSDLDMERLEKFLNESLQGSAQIQSICDSFADEIHVQKITDVRRDGDSWVVDLVIGFSDVRLDGCCGAIPIEKKTVDGTMTVDASLTDASLVLGVHWDTDNEGY